MRHRRERFVPAVGAVAAFALLLSACTSGSGSTKSTSGSTLTVAIALDLTTGLDNLTLTGSDDRTIMGNVYEALFTTDKDGNPLPNLALSATPNANDTVWDVKLRRGVKFSNGDAFNADVVKANFEAFVNPKNASPYASTLADIKSVDVVNPYEVKFTLAAPWSRFPERFTDYYFIGDLGARGGSQLLTPGQTPIGTGPYVYASRQPGTSVTLKANPNYWRGKPAYQTVVFKVIPDVQLAVAAFKKGDVDIIFGYLDKTSIDALKTDPSVQILSKPSNEIHQIHLNFQKEPSGYTDMNKVHEGFEYLINPQKELPAIVEGYGTIADQEIPPDQAGTDPSMTPFPYDPAKGEQLLAEGGINKGDKISILAVDEGKMCDWGTVVQSELKQDGYDAQLQCQDQDTADKTKLNYTWDLGISSYSGRASAVQYWADRYNIALADPKTKENWQTLQDPQLQSLIGQMERTTDNSEYNAIGAQLAERMLKTDYAEIPGFWPNVTAAESSRVTGLELSTIEWYGFLDSGIGELKPAA